MPPPQVDPSGSVNLLAFQGRVQVADDRCPHKGARMSRGRVCDGALVCPYHGFRFDGAGRCTHMPVDPEQAPPRSMRLSGWSTREANALVWVWVGTGQPTGDPPWFDDLRGDRPASAAGALVYDVHYSRLIESNFDVYHFPFVDGSIDPGVGGRVVDPQVRVDGEAIYTTGALVSAKGTRTPFAIDFLPPNLQRLRFAGIDGIIISTPIDARRTWAFGRYEQSLVTRPVFLSRWLAAAALWFEWNVVQSRQDMPMLSTLDPIEAAPGACVWVRADAGAARYVQWRARQQRRAELETARASTAV